MNIPKGLIKGTFLCKEIPKETRAKEIGRAYWDDESHILYVVQKD